MDSDVSTADGVASNGKGAGTKQKDHRSLFARVVNGDPQTMTRRAIHGSIWTIAGYGGAQVLRFASNLILTRWLTPEAYGSMAIVTVWMQGLQMFSDFGIAPSLIQHRHATNPIFYNTAWTMQVIRGFALAMVGCALALPLSRFYEVPLLAPAIMVTSITAIIQGFTPTKLYSAGRELRLPRLICIEISAQIVATVVMISLAITWRTVWPLVIGGIVFSLTKVVLSHVALPGATNHLHWDRHSALELYRFGRWIFASSLFTFLGMYTDRLMLGKLVPLGVLGVYSIALQVVNIIIGVFEQLTNRVLMPAMSHWSRTSESRFRQVVFDSRRFILSGAAIAVGNLILLAPTLFAWLYDSRYHDAGHYTQLLGFGLWFTLLQRTSQASLLAAGESRALAAANATNCFVTCIAAWLGFRWWGLAGFIAGWTLGNLSGVVVVEIYLAMRGINLVRQDVVLTAGVVAFVASGFLLHDILVAYIPLNIWPVVAELSPAMLLTLVAGSLLWFSYPRSMSLRARIFGSDLASAEDEEASETARAILHTSENDVFSGASQD